MNTELSKTNFKDNVATASLVTAALVAVFSMIFNSSEVRAAQPAAMQKLEAIVVTAPRIPVTQMPAIVVTASRENKVLVASN